MLKIYSNTLRTVEPEQFPEEEESTEEEVEKETPRPKNYQRMSLDSTFDLRRLAVKRARKLGDDDDDGSGDDNSDDSLDSIDFPQTQRTPKTPKTSNTPKTPSNTPDILEKKRKLYIKSMKQFRNTKDPWTEEEKLACRFFHMALRTIQKSEVEANLKEFQPQLSKVSANKIHHKVKAAWMNGNKKFPFQ